MQTLNAFLLIPFIMRKTSNKKKPESKIMLNVNSYKLFVQRNDVILILTKYDF